MAAKTAKDFADLEAMTKVQENFFLRMHKITLDDIDAAVQRKDWYSVAKEFYLYGEFLTKHPEALLVIPG